MSKKKSFALRLDPSMHDALQRWADAELRSINAQMEWALRDALRRAGRWPEDEASADKHSDTASDSSGTASDSSGIASDHSGTASDH